LTSLLVDAPLFRQKDPEIAEIHELLQVIQTSSGMLVTIVNNILDFNRYERDDFALELAPFSLRDTLETAIEIVYTQDDRGQ
jgi:signal transduction histidine kinase